MTVLSALVSVLVLAQGCAFAAIAPRRASTFAGVTSSAVFPPPGAAITAAGTLFQDGSQVGFPGPTATGDEAAAIQTAPAVAIVDSIFPLIQPNPLGGPTKENGKPFNILDHVGQLSPWQSVDSFGLPKASAKVPNGCSLSQVHLLHRHGARYPTGDSAVASFAAKVHSTASTTGFTATGPASFLNTWKYKLGSEILTPFGRSQLFNLGVGFRIKYGELLKGFQDLPVFRTTSEARMLDSALHFAAGFFGVQDYQSQYHQLITIENDGQNNTLSPFDNCANANNVINAFGNVQTNKWVNIYLQPALKRIGAEMKGFNLTLGDLTIMQQLCAYETVALGFSEFCDLFTKEEWEGFEYSIDLNFWYANGPGNPAASAQGIGYVQELVARLTQKPITTFDSAVNKSIVTNKALFPLNQPIFVDATHDTVLSIILTAMNFTSLAATGPLPTDHIPENRSYNINHIAPFGTNLVGQVLSCPASKEPTHIRWILNDAVLPLTGVHGCKANSDGLCDLKTYIAAMQQRIKEVDFNFDCFGNYTIPQPDKIIDGRFPKNLRK